MDKREKVIAHLGILRTWCAVNPKYGMALSIEDCDKAVVWLDDALALLKAQEPLDVDEWPDEFLCPTCKTRLAGRSHDDCVLLETNDTPNFCWVCGQAVKWDAQEQRDYEAAVEMAEYCERYEPTYNPEDGSM